MQGCVFNLILRDNLWCHRWTCGTHEPTCGIDVGPELGSVPSSSRSSWFDLIFGVFEASVIIRIKCHETNSFESENFSQNTCPLEGN